MCHHCYERDPEDHGGHNRCCHCGNDRASDSPPQETSGPGWKCRTHGQYFPACVPCAVQSFIDERDAALRLNGEKDALIAGFNRLYSVVRYEHYGVCKLTGCGICKEVDALCKLPTSEKRVVSSTHDAARCKCGRYFIEHEDEEEACCQACGKKHGGQHCPIAR